MIDQETTKITTTKKTCITKTKFIETMSTKLLTDKDLSTDIAADAASDIKAVTPKAVVDYVTGKDFELLNADYLIQGEYSMVSAETGIGSFRGTIGSNLSYSDSANVGDIFSSEGDFFIVRVLADSNDSFSDADVTTVNIGKWSIAKESDLVNNNIVIFNGKHWPVINSLSFNGTTPDINTVAYGGAFGFTTSGVGYVKIDVSSAARWNSAYESSSRGILTTESRNIVGDWMEGDEIYNITLHKKQFYNGSSWETITSVVEI